MCQPGWEEGLGEKWIHVCMAESLCSSPETTTTLLISYTPKQNNFSVKEKNRNFRRYRQQFRRPGLLVLFSWLTRCSTNEELMPARVGCNGPYHLEGSPHFPFLPELCPEAAKHTAFRYRKCSLPCAGAPYTDFPFICLQSIFVWPSKPLEILHKTQQAEARVTHSNLTKGKKQMTCTFLQGHICAA